MSEKTLWQRITALVRQPATPSLDDNLELVNGPKFSQNVSKRIYEIAYNGSALEAYTSSDVKGKRLTERGRDIVDFLSRYDGELAASEGRFTGQGFDYDFAERFVRYVFGIERENAANPAKVVSQVGRNPSLRIELNGGNDPSVIKMTLISILNNSKSDFSDEIIQFQKEKGIGPYNVSGRPYK